MNITIFSYKIGVVHEPVFDTSKEIKHEFRGVTVKEMHERYVCIALNSLEEFIAIGRILDFIRFYYEVNFAEKSYKIIMNKVICSAN